MIICLEHWSKTLKIFYQGKLAEPKKDDKKKESKSSNNIGASIQARYPRKEDKVDTLLEYNPYANIDGIDGGENQ